MLDTTRKDGTPVTGTWVRRLRPEPGVPCESVCEPATLEKAEAQVGTDAVAWAVQLGHQMAVRCIDEMPVLGTGEAAVRSMRLGTESAAIRTLVGIDQGRVVDGGATPEVVEQMRDYVHRRIPLPAVWAAIRLGHSWFADGYMAACKELVEAAELPEQFELISRVLFDFVNPFSSGVGDAYTEEYERWVTSANAARDEAVRAVLEGDDVDLRHASNALRYEIQHRYHVAVIMWVREPDPTDTTALQTLGKKVMERIGASQSLLMPVGQSEMWAWAGSASKFAPTADLADQLRFDDVGIAMGRPGHGVDGFRTSHQQALETLRVTREYRPTFGEAVSFDQVSLLALLTRDPDRARTFMFDELGGLAADEPHVADLRDTLLAYYACRRSPQATAAKLYVARNTVVYRLKRAEELLGHSTEEREAELWTALLLAGVYGVTAPA